MHNRQRGLPVPTGWLQQFAEIALEKCLPRSADERHALRQLAEVEIAIVSDRVIADVHRRFMNIPGPTDVITFEHGEIVMSAQTAERHAEEYGHPFHHELALYLIHGLLHLNGYEDASPGAAAIMHRLQQRLLQACLARVPAL